MVSVIVPVYNGEGIIETCLRALADQSWPKSDYEVIVVNDGSTDNTPEILEKLDVTVVTQERQGPAAARNAGIATAKGDVVLLTDADCAPDPAWIENMVRPLSDPEIVGTRGIYRTRQRELVARFAQIEYEEKYEKLKKDKYIDFIDTSSAGYRKDVIFGAGGFSTAFTEASNEDPDLSYRLAKKGYKLVLNADAVVYHRHASKLLTYLKRKFKAAVWRVLLYKRHPGKMVTDSHTPQLLKVQIGLFYMIMGGLILWNFFPEHFYVVPAAVAAFILSCVPFIVFAARKDPAVAVVAPLFLFLRSTVFAGGLIFGFTKLSSKMPKGAEGKSVS